MPYAICEVVRGFEIKPKKNTDMSLHEILNLIEIDYHKLEIKYNSESGQACCGLTYFKFDETSNDKVDDILPHLTPTAMKVQEANAYCKEWKDKIAKHFEENKENYELSDDEVKSIVDSIPEHPYNFFFWRRS